MPCSFAFTKLVVADLLAMTRYYRAVYGLGQVDRLGGRIGTEQIDEIVLSDGSGPPLILIEFAGRPAPPVGEVMLGFFTEDLSAVVKRCEAEGGKVIVGPESHGAMKVAFLSDPEGHVTEVVEHQPGRASSLGSSGVEDGGTARMNISSDKSIFHLNINE